MAIWTCSTRTTGTDVATEVVILQKPKGPIIRYDYYIFNKTDINSDTCKNRIQKGKSLNIHEINIEIGI